MATVRAKSKLDSSGFRSGVDSMKSKVRGFAQQLGPMGGLIAGAFSAGAVIELTRRIAGLTKSLILAAAKMERLETQFVALGLSAADAEKTMKDLREFATKTPFQLTDIAEASQQLFLLSDGVLGGIDSLKLFGDAAAAGGQDLSTLAFWVGRLFFALKSGQPILDAMTALVRLKAITPDAFAEMRKLSEEGADGAKIWDVYTASLGRFTGAMERTSKTVEGRVSTLKDTAIELQAAYGETFETETKFGLKLITSILAITKQLKPKPLVQLDNLNRAVDLVKELRKGEAFLPALGKTFLGIGKEIGIGLPGGFDLPGGEPSVDPATKALKKRLAAAEESLRFEQLILAEKIKSTQADIKSLTIQETVQEDMQKRLNISIALVAASKRLVGLEKEQAQEGARRARDEERNLDTITRKGKVKFRKLIRAKERIEALDERTIGLQAADRLAQIGGFIGGQISPQARIADKQLQVAEETNKILKSVAPDVARGLQRFFGLQ